MVMEGIRKVADTGRTIVCTIRQPSTDVFSVFDSLLLLKRGGHLVYFGDLGEKSRELVGYFEAINGVPSLPLTYNPATWMLEIISDSSAKNDFIAIYKESEKWIELQQRLGEAGIGRPTAGSVALTYKTKRAASNFTQGKILMRRFADMYARTPDYTVVRTVVNIVLALIIGFTFYNSSFDTYQEVNAGIGLIFTSTVFIGAVSFDSVRPISMESRNIYYRERASQTYNALWYFIGGSLIEIPYVFFSTLCFTAVFYPVVGFSGFDRFLLYWLHMSTFVLTMTYFGQLLAFILPTLEVASAFSILFTAVFFLFSGFNPPANQIPDTHKWLYDIVPPTYPISILSSLVLGQCESESDVGCQKMEGVPPTLPQNLTVKEYLDTVFDMKYDDMWKHFGIMIAILIVLRIAALLALRFVNHQKR